MRLLNAVWLTLLAGCAQAELKPLFDSQRLDASLADARALQMCQARLSGFPPYRGALQMDSKYDQSRTSKDVLDAKAAKRYREQVDEIYGYLAFLGQISDYMRSGNPALRQAASECFSQAISAWAEAGAMTPSKASKQGEAVRKWFLAAVATNMMKAQALTDWQPDPAQRQWLAALADRVQRYATPRRQRLDLYNNHDYWSCWAVMAAGLVLNEPDRLAWAEQGYWLAIGQITPYQDGVVLPHEAARGTRAAEYHAFALTPLVLMAESGSRNGLDLYEGKGAVLHELAAQVVHFWRQDGQGVRFAQKQEAIDDHMMAWWPVYAHRFPERQPLSGKQAEAFGSRFTGGSLTGLWVEHP